MLNCKRKIRNILTEKNRLNLDKNYTHPSVTIPQPFGLTGVYWGRGCGEEDEGIKTSCLVLVSSSVL